MRKIVILGFIFCLGFFITSCASLTAFLDRQPTDTATAQDEQETKRVPLPPTVKDFAVEPLNP